MKNLSIYKASAGSGKTFTLAVEYIALLAINPMEYQNILAVTFTNKATAEMKQRILSTLYAIAHGLQEGEGYVENILTNLAERKKMPQDHEEPYPSVLQNMNRDMLRKRAKEALSNIIHDYSRFHIETIDSFFQGIVHEIANELELSTKMKVELDETEVLSDAITQIIENLKEGSSEFRTIIDFIEEKIQENHSWQVEETVKEFGRNIFKEKYLIHGEEVRRKITNFSEIYKYRALIHQYLEQKRQTVIMLGYKMLEAYENIGITEEDGSKNIVTFMEKVRDYNITEPTNKSRGTFSDSIETYTEDAGKWFKKSSKNRDALLPQVETVLMPMLTEAFEKHQEYVSHLHTVNAIGQHLYSLMLLNEISQMVKLLNEKGNRFLLSETANFLRNVINNQDIPFIYEKESIGYGNRIVPNLKWSTDVARAKRVRAYLTELAQLMRTKVLLENGDITKTRLVWFYPLAMKVGNVNKMAEAWRKTFKEVFGIEPTDQNLIQMPESVAPYYFYKSSSKFRGSASNVASIDIGGGSSDVVVFESGAKQPVILTSFRFAANVLFGDGFSEVPHGDSNPMLVKYVDYFKRLFDADDERYGELNGILDDITSKRKSEDINAFLFSVQNNKVVGGNDVFSYNQRLNEDPQRKLIFIYFYVTLVYYVARMMKQRQLAKPRSLMFSGTGSKVLDIVGTNRDLDLLTQAVFERVYGEKYDVDGFSVVMERNEPKQITCRGALMQVRDEKGYESIDTLNKLLDNFDTPLKFNYSMIGKEKLVYDDMTSADIRKELVDAVREYNEFFCNLCDEMHVVDRFLVDNKSLVRFRELVNKDLEHHLLNGWNFVNKNADEKNGSDPIEDTVFFYPIIGSIRDNLIENL